MLRTHEMQHRVTYAETDMMGYVYYANYLMYFEIGRTEMFREHAIPYKKLEDMGYYLPVAEASCKYHSPARYDDLLTIRTKLTLFKGVRLGFSYEILRDGQLLAEGSTLSVYVDAEGRPKKLLPIIVEEMEKFIAEAKA